MSHGFTLWYGKTEDLEVELASNVDLVIVADNETQVVWHGNGDRDTGWRFNPCFVSTSYDVSG